MPCLQSQYHLQILKVHKPKKLQMKKNAHIKTLHGDEEEKKL